MHLGWKIFWVVIAILLASSGIILAGKAVFDVMNPVPSGGNPVVDYNAVVVILLTTVTVIFSFCAVVLAIIGIIGFRNLRINAGRYAEGKVHQNIENAFKEDGVAIERIDIEFRKEDGHFRPWMKERIRKEVIALLPLIADRALGNGNHGSVVTEMAAGEPTDEGETD